MTPERSLGALADLQLQTISVDVEGAVVVLGLNRPNQRNAINRPLMAETAQALAIIAEDSRYRAVVLRGHGPGFCAGFDLKDDAASHVSGAQGWRQILQENLDFVLQFWNFPKPTIAAVHGACVAGGCDLAFACDLTVAEPNALFRKPELHFGSVNTLVMLPWLTAPKVAKALLLGADDHLSALRAEQLGLVNQLAEDPLEKAREIAGRLARLDPEAVKVTKAAINRGIAHGGLGNALTQGLEAAVGIEAHPSPARETFKALTLREGLKAALAWREQHMNSRPGHSPEADANRERETTSEPTPEPTSKPKVAERKT